MEVKDFINWIRPITALKPDCHFVIKCGNEIFDISCIVIDCEGATLLIEH